MGILLYPTDVNSFLDMMNDTSIQKTDGFSFPHRPVKIVFREHNTVVGRFVGEIGLQEKDTFFGGMTDLIDDNIQKIILDFSQASLSRSALGGLISFAAQVHGYSKRMYLYKVSDQIRTNLDEIALSAFFSFLTSEDDLVMHLVI